MESCGWYCGVMVGNVVRGERRSWGGWEREGKNERERGLFLFVSIQAGCSFLYVWASCIVQMMDLIGLVRDLRSFVLFLSLFLFLRGISPPGWASRICYASNGRRICYASNCRILWTLVG